MCRYLASTFTYLLKKQILEDNMIRSSLLVACAALFACSSDKSTDSGDIAEASAEEQGCDVTIDETFPVSGASDFYYRGVLAFELSDDDSTATLALQDSAGAAVAGEHTMDGDMHWFMPAEALAPSTSYVAVLNYCGDEDPVNVEFSTSSLGGAVDGGDASLVGSTYAVDLSSGNFVEPAGVGDLIGGMLENNILIGIKDVADGKLHIRGALSEAGNVNQDYCAQTLESFPEADFSESPYFQIPEGNVDISVAGYDVTINSMSLSGTFAADGSYFGGATLSGELDARDIGPLLEGTIDSTEPEEICGLLMGFGVQCVECSSDALPYCISLVVDRLAADNTETTIGLVCETECHESCSENAETCTEPQAADLGECPAE
jgi:hypothetical protein